MLCVFVHYSKRISTDILRTPFYNRGYITDIHGDTSLLRIDNGVKKIETDIERISGFHERYPFDIRGEDGYFLLAGELLTIQNL